MKIRQGFVSNSSSSSFVCLVSGAIEGGYDLSLSDAGYCECVNGHTFCQEYLLDKPLAVESTIVDEDDYCDDDEDPSYDVPANQCPICTRKNITDSDLLTYAIKKNNWDRKLMEDGLRNDYADWKAFEMGMKS